MYGGCVFDLHTFGHNQLGVVVEMTLMIAYIIKGRNTLHQDNTLKLLHNEHMMILRMFVVWIRTPLTILGAKIVLHFEIMFIFHKINNNKWRWGGE